jgi:UDP-glucose 4-epimerase
VLVTGGAGYIGSHAAKALRQAGHHVVIYDNLSAGIERRRSGRHSIEGDVQDVDAVRRALRDSGASAVMHFAAWLIVSDSVRDPIGYYRNNVAGALATLEAMAAEQCRRFIFSSTCAVYGEPVETPIRETHARHRSTPTDRRSWRWSTRCRISSVRTASDRFACGTSTRPAPIRMVSWEKITHRKFT